MRTADRSGSARPSDELDAEAGAALRGGGGSPTRRGALASNLPGTTWNTETIRLTEPRPPSLVSRTAVSQLS